MKKKIDHKKQPGRIIRYGYIDALRGWAILGVIFGHCYPRVRGIPDWLGTIGSQGGRGVQLFFMISALTLFFSFNARYDNEKRALLNYFIRRFFRIAPLFYTGIIFYLWLDGTQPRFWAPQGINWGHILSTVFFVHGWHPSTFNSVVPGGWSIAVEAMFYLILPLCFHKIKDMHIAGWFVFVALLFSILCNTYTTFLLDHFSDFPIYRINAFTTLWFPSQLPVFSLGFLLYFMIGALGKERTIGEKDIQKSLLFSSIALYLILTLPFGSFKYIPQYFIYGIAFVFLVYALSVYPQILWVNRMTCYIGKISFSCYIFHFASIRVANRFLFPSNPTLFAQIPPLLQILIFYGLVLLLTILISHFSFKFIETPGIEVGKKIIYRLEKSS